MKFHTRKWVKPEDLNANGSLFGGKLLSWIDEEAALYTIIQFENNKVVTKFMSEINFMSSAKQGEHCRNWDRSSKIWCFFFSFKMRSTK